VSTTELLDIGHRICNFCLTLKTTLYKMPGFRSFLGHRRSKSDTTGKYVCTTIPTCTMYMNCIQLSKYFFSSTRKQESVFKMHVCITHYYSGISRLSLFSFLGWWDVMNNLVCAKVIIFCGYLINDASAKIQKIPNHS
jgi:hypothetical protein